MLLDTYGFTQFLDEPALTSTSVQNTCWQSTARHRHVEALLFFMLQLYISNMFTFHFFVVAVLCLHWGQVLAQKTQTRLHFVLTFHQKYLLLLALRDRKNVTMSH